MCARFISAQCERLYWVLLSVMVTLVFLLYSAVFVSKSARLSPSTRTEQSRGDRWSEDNVTRIDSNSLRYCKCNTSFQTREMHHYTGKWHFLKHIVSLGYPDCGVATLIRGLSWCFILEWLSCVWYQAVKCSITSPVWSSIWLNIKQVWKCLYWPSPTVEHRFRSGVEKNKGAFRLVPLMPLLIEAPAVYGNRHRAVKPSDQHDFIREKPKHWSAKSCKQEPSQQLLSS